MTATTRRWQCPGCGVVGSIPIDATPEHCSRCLASRDKAAKGEGHPPEQRSERATAGRPGRQRYPAFGPARLYGVLIGAVAGFLAGILIAWSESDDWDLPLFPAVVCLLTVIAGVIAGWVKGPAMVRRHNDLLEFVKNPDFALTKQLNDEDATDRLQCALLLVGRIGPEATAAVPVLLEALEDTDKSVRQVAAQALSRIGPAARDAMPALKAVSENDRVRKVRKAAASALESIGCEVE